MSILERASHVAQQVRGLPSDLARRAKANVVRTRAWLWNERNKNQYTHLDKDALSRNHSSDKVFVFGSGSSINDITDEEWDHIAEHDTLGFNWFMHQDQVRMDYHLIREVVGPGNLDPEVWKPKVRDYARLIRENPHYDDTIFLVQGGWKAINANRIVGLGLCPRTRGSSASGTTAATVRPARPSRRASSTRPAP